MFGNLKFEIPLFLSFLSLRDYITIWRMNIKGNNTYPYNIIFTLVKVFHLFDMLMCHLNPVP